jgi:competence protein ComEA
MIARILAGLLAAVASACQAAPVDANQATRAELESVGAIGTALAQEILDERRKGTFKDWHELIDRVRGVGEHNAARLSAEGLTVNGASYSGATPARRKKSANVAPATAESPPASVPTK